ncbi:VOC family protein [Rhodobacteraceae bacterium M385]|nr:VOC family protein [Rhodobacteraceae bacterium M385]
MSILSLVKNSEPAATTDRLSWGVVELQVTDLERAVAFWTSALGLVDRNHAAPGVALGTAERTLFVLHSGATAPVEAAFTGMYHVAIGVRSQAEFSRMLARLLHLQIPVSPTDHLMSKSLYLVDPDGLEIEITFETPGRFGRMGDMSRGLIMFDAEGRPHNGREALNLSEELAHAETADLMAPLADDSYLAHLHFKVAALEPALDWYKRLGFQNHLTLAGWGFADMGAGKPNTHRLAMNTWAGPNRPAAPDHMARLLRYEVIAHDPALLENAGLQRNGDSAHGIDPTGVEITLRTVTSGKDA